MGFLAGYSCTLFSGCGLITWGLVVPLACLLSLVLTSVISGDVSLSWCVWLGFVSSFFLGKRKVENCLTGVGYISYKADYEFGQKQGQGSTGA